MQLIFRSKLQFCAKRIANRSWNVRSSINIEKGRETKDTTVDISRRMRRYSQRIDGNVGIRVAGSKTRRDRDSKYQALGNKFVLKLSPLYHVWTVDRSRKDFG